MPSDTVQLLRGKSPFHKTEVYRRGAVVVRESAPWTPTVHALLRHLESVNFPAPRIAGSGFDAEGRQTLTYLEGDFVHPGPWSLEGVAAVGALLRRLHDATASFNPPSGASWAPWFLRDLGGRRRRIVGHCDFTPWNIVARGGLPIGVIDWDFAGPVDPLVELAQSCWLNAQLHADDVAERVGLAPLAERAKQLRTMVDAYGLPSMQRRGFVDKIAQFTIHYAAYQADDAGVTQDGPHDPAVVWGITWPARSGAWILRNRRVLQNALS